MLSFPESATDLSGIRLVGESVTQLQVAANLTLLITDRFQLTRFIAMGLNVLTRFAQ